MSRVFGSHDEALVRGILQSTDVFVETLASEIETARARVAPDLSVEFAAIATRVLGVIDSGTQIVDYDG